MTAWHVSHPIHLFNAYCTHPPDYTLLTEFIFSMHITLTHLTTLLRWRTWTEADGISTLIITCPDQRSRQMTPMHAYSPVLNPWKRFNGINVVLLTLPSEVAHHRQQYRSAHTQFPCMDNMCATIDHCFTFFECNVAEGELLFI